MKAAENAASHSDTERMQLRAQVLLSSELIAHYWPMRYFVHHNPLHGLEHLHFEEAVRRGQQILGGNGYLPTRLFREYWHSGRIAPQHLRAALEPLALDRRVALGARREVSHFDVLRAHLLAGNTAPADESIEAMIDGPDRAALAALADHLPTSVEASADLEAATEQAALGRRWTLAGWCDRTLHTELSHQIDRESIKWCQAFLDEGHAAWSMPGRERGFYGAWKLLAGREWSPCGIPGSRKKIAGLPESPEDALLEHLAALGIPPEVREDYLSLHLGSLRGWAGFIKWRAEQTEYEWQEAHPIDLVQFLSVRLWYERELVEKTCRAALGIGGRFEAISSLLRLRGTARASRPPRTARLAAAWRLTALARALEIAPALLLEAAPEALGALLDWTDAFPESQHGPVWLRAFEAGYREHLVGKLRPALSGEARDGRRSVRPQGQVVFCIDVRSESLRRHLEAVGDYDTLGFAGFFGVCIRFRALGSHHETDQYPAILSAKNTVREVVRTYHGDLLLRHRAGARLLHAGHQLLHDLKGNLVTPYVMVESLGWLFSLPLVGKTVLPELYRRWSARFRRAFVPPVATAITIDKLQRQAVDELLAADQRGVIRRALQDRFGDRNSKLSLERLEFLRQRALEETEADHPQGASPHAALTAEEEASFIDELRHRHDINRKAAFARMERITRMGFTLTERAVAVETSLRVMGLTRNLARLILICGHGSTSDNNPFEAALDCGACGGNPGSPNARVLAAMANQPQVREQLARNGIAIPGDTYFIAGQHDTTTDEVQLFDLEDLPHTHTRDVVRLTTDLREAALRNNRERCARFPEIAGVPTTARAAREVRRRSGDWSQVRPEWGLSGNAAFVIGPRDLTRRIDLEGRVFLHSYDHREDATGAFLENVMIGPQVVAQWINMEHYFSTVDQEVYGSGSKIFHNVVGRLGIMSGPQSDLRTGLAWQTVMNGHRPYHEPMRLLTLIEAPRERIDRIIHRHRPLQQLYDNEWVHLVALEPDEKVFYSYRPKEGWTIHDSKEPNP